MPLARARDWKLYLALSDICEFKVLPEYLVGYRQYRKYVEERHRDGPIEATCYTLDFFEKWLDLPN